MRLTWHPWHSFQGTRLLGGAAVEVISPDGQRFIVEDEDKDEDGPGPLAEVALNVEALDRSLGEGCAGRGCFCQMGDAIVRQ